jgi:hypothetical protein
MVVQGRDRRAGECFVKGCGSVTNLDLFSASLRTKLPLGLERAGENKE